MTGTGFLSWSPGHHIDTVTPFKQSDACFMQKFHGLQTAVYATVPDIPSSPFGKGSDTETTTMHKWCSEKPIDQVSTTGAVQAEILCLSLYKVCMTDCICSSWYHDLKMHLCDSRPPHWTPHPHPPPLHLLYGSLTEFLSIVKVAWQYHCCTTVNNREWASDIPV